MLYRLYGGLYDVRTLYSVLVSLVLLCVSCNAQDYCVLYFIILHMYMFTHLTQCCLTAFCFTCFVRCGYFLLLNVSVSVFWVNCS